MVAVLMLIGCRKEGDRVNWDVDALAPLVYTSLTIDDLVPDSLLAYDENEAVFLSFSDTVLKFELDTLINLPDTSIVESFTFPVSLPNPLDPGTSIPAIDEEIELNANDVELKKALIKQGQIVVDIVNTFQGAIFCTYTIPHATLNGQPLLIQELVPGSPGETTVVQVSLDVSGYWLDFSNGSEPFNHLATELTMVADPNGSPLPVSAGDGVEVTTTFQDLQPAFAEGYFGQQVVNTGSEVQEVNAFDIIQGGSIDLDEVNVNLRILNGFGVDIRATIFQFDANNTSFQDNTSLNHSIVGAPINLNRATHPDGVPIPSVYDISLNGTNSDIDLMLESLPDNIAVEADLELNPLGNISNHHDFAYAESSIDGVLDVDIPLCLIANELVLSDTSGFSADNALENVNSGKIILQINNGFPLEGKLWLEALSEDQSPMILLDGEAFSAGMTNSDFVVTAPVYSEVHLNLDPGDIEKLIIADQLVIKAELSTSSLTEHVKLYRHYTMDVKVVADFNYHVND